MFAECDKHYPSRSRQTSLATAVTNITKPVTKNNFGPSTYFIIFSYAGSSILLNYLTILWLIKCALPMHIVSIYIHSPFPLSQGWSFSVNPADSPNL